MEMMMTQREARHGQIMELSGYKKVKQREAVQQLGLSVRQVKRLMRGYLGAGLAGLISKRRGKASSRRLTEMVRQEIVRIMTVSYSDFSLSFAYEKLAEYKNHRANIR